MKKGCGFYFYILLILCGIYFIYKKYFVYEKEWITTEEGIKFYTFRENNVVYSWKGENLGGGIHNKGKLKIINTNNKQYTIQNLNAFWGSVTSQDWVITKLGRFLGAVKDDKPSGYGVLIKGTKTLVGNFKNGLLEGYGMEYNNNSLVYRGEFEDNLYNGFGALFKDGEMIADNWKNGNVYHGYITEKTETISRLWNRFVGNDDDNGDKSSLYMTSEEFSQLKKEEFQQYLNLKLEIYIEDKINKVIENRTSFFSFQPFRMFWQSLFSTRIDRTNSWFVAFEQNGLSKVDLEFFINSYVNKYNKENINRVHLDNIFLNRLESSSIITDKSFNLLQDMELAGWSENFWFDALLTYIIVFIITSIIGIFAIPFFIPLKALDVIISAIVCIFVIILSFVLNNIKPDFLNDICLNYLNYLLIQIKL